MTIVLLIRFILKLFSKNDIFMNYNQIKSIYGSLVERQSEILNLDKNLILGIIKQESSGDFSAIGENNEVGLMQVSPIALLEYNIQTGNNIFLYELLNPETAIKVGSYYLKWIMLKTNWSEKKSLQAYNAGISAVKRNNEQSLKYADSVLIHKTQFKGV